ncbi:MAG: STM4013/SEN3800 family hydrolase [Paracoccaceae bacterium]
MPLDATSCLGSHDVLFLTIDSLRYDVAKQAMAAGRTPVLAHALGHWDHRHSPASFTYAAHQAFFAGFLPTPATPERAGEHRLFAARFAGSQSTGPNTLEFDAPDIVTGFAQANYRTICIGGTGFFNKQTPLGNTLPSLFHESWWSPAMGVTNARSQDHQVAKACERLAATQGPVFLFMNLSACHAPHHAYLGAARRDSIQSQTAALEALDTALAGLFASLKGSTLLIVCSDHGDAFGEDGFHGHRLGHTTVWDVPYGEAILQGPLR